MTFTGEEQAAFARLRASREWRKLKTSGLTPGSSGPARINDDPNVTKIRQQQNDEKLLSSPSISLSPLRAATQSSAAACESSAPQKLQSSPSQLKGGSHVAMLRPSPMLKAYNKMGRDATSKRKLEYSSDFNSKRIKINLSLPTTPTSNVARSHVARWDRPTAHRRRPVGHSSWPNKCIGERWIEMARAVEPQAQLIAQPWENFPAAPIKPRTADQSPKIQRDVPKTPRGLHNEAQACYQNAILQVLHEVPEIARLILPSGPGSRVIRIFSEAELIMASRKSRCGDEIREAVDRVLSQAQESDGLKFTPYLADMMQSMSVASERPVYPYLVHQVSGKLMGESFNGATQESVDEYFQHVLQTLGRESPNEDIESLFHTVFEQRRHCSNCGETKSIQSHSLDLQIAEIDRSAGSTVRLGDMLAKAMEDTSDFENHDRSCDQCSAREQWTEIPDWTGFAAKRVNQAAKYLMVLIPREDYQRTTHGGFVPRKIRTDVVLQAGNLSLHATEGSVVRYEFFASVQHHGDEMTRGHYTTIKKVGSTWFHCNDSEVSRLSPSDIRKSTQSRMVFFRKIENQREGGPGLCKP